MKLTHIIQPDGTVDTKLGTAYEATIREAIGGMPERVAVIFGGKPTLMYVEERSAVRNLPINARATAIYWTATMQGRTGVHFDPLNAPMVHGTAVVLEGVSPRDEGPQI